MDIYYYSGSDRIGPINKENLEQLAQEGKITPDTIIEVPEKGIQAPAAKIKGLVFDTIKYDMNSIDNGYDYSMFYYMFISISVILECMLLFVIAIMEDVPAVFSIFIVLASPLALLNIFIFIWFILSTKEIKKNIREIKSILSQSKKN